VIRRRLVGESQKAGRWITGVSQIEFSPYMYIRSSPRRPNRDPNRTLSNELLLLLYNKEEEGNKIYLGYAKTYYNKIYLKLPCYSLIYKANV
jgi:hypothetical protein